MRNQYVQYEHYRCAIECINSMTILRVPISQGFTFYGLTRHFTKHHNQIWTSGVLM